MTLRIPRGGAALLIGFAVVGVAIFLVLAARFGGPTIRLSEPYEVVAPIADTQGLATRSDVLVRGVKVGQVESIERAGGVANVTLGIEDESVPLKRDATVRVGLKTLLGEAYVEVDPGASDTLLPDGTQLDSKAVLPSVEVDEALSAVGAEARADVRGTLAEAGRGARAAETPQRVGETLAELRRVTGGLRELGSALEHQAPELRSAVSDSSAVVGEIGRREQSLAALVQGTRRTLDALASNQDALRGGIRALPDLLNSARATLAEADPLMREARPLLSYVRGASPALASAFDQLPPVARDASALLDAAPEFERAAEPLLARAQPLVEELRPLARELGPALANVVPIVRFLSPRRDAIAAWFSNTADLGLNGDSKGSWARFFIFLEPGTAFARSGGDYQTNAYTPPGDAAANRSYQPGSYPRLKPFTPASP